MITLDDIKAVMQSQVDRDITNQAICEDLGIDVPSLLSDPEWATGPNVGHFMAGLTVGIELGRGMAAERAAVLHEMDHHHDEFLATLPEAYDSHTQGD